MTNRRALTDEHRRQLVQQLTRLGTDADQQHDMLHVFLPLPVHEVALRPETMVILGERGAGKTALFKILGRLVGEPENLKRVFPAAQLSNVEWLEGFSESNSLHPSVQVLDSFAEGTNGLEGLRLFWTAHLCGVLGHALRNLPAPPPPAVMNPWLEHRNQPGAWVEAARSNVGALSAWLDSIDAQLQARDQFVLVTYDHLDRIGVFDPDKRRRYVASLLALWMSLGNRYRCLRAKIFLREDLFEAGQQAFPDASKLRPRSVSLQWSVEALYRMLIRHMAALSPEMREWLDSGVNRVPLTCDPLLQWMPPSTLPEEGRPSQKAFTDHMVSERMGTGMQTAFTYRWIPNRLQDAYIRVMPRSVLNLIRSAAQEALKQTPRAAYSRLLDPKELEAGLVETSRNRVAELTEEHKVVGRLAHLRNKTVTLSREEVEQALSRSADEPDGFKEDGSAVLDELVRLGVLIVRSRDGRIDVPDLYRFGFGIKRKGGVPKPR